MRKFILGKKTVGSLTYPRTYKPVHNVPMHDDEQTFEESPELSARREKLRAYADLLLDNTISLPMPETHLDSERAAKSVIATDRMLVMVFSAPVMPRAARPARESTPPPRKSKPQYVYNDKIYDEDPPEEVVEALRNDILAKLDRLADAREEAKKTMPAEELKALIEQENEHRRIFEAHLQAQKDEKTQAAKFETKAFKPYSNRFEHFGNDP